MRQEAFFMWDLIAPFLLQCAVIVTDALLILFLPANVFAGLAIFSKGLTPALTAARRAIHETRVNLSIHILDSLIVAPFLVVLLAFAVNVADKFSLRLIDPGFWNNL